MKKVVLIFFILITFSSKALTNNRVNSVHSFLESNFLSYENTEKTFKRQHLNDRVAKKWFKYFTGKGRENFKRQVARGFKYKNIIDFIFHTKNIPKELFFLGLIESGFSLNIKSHAGARGPWQFMPETARRYGLRVDKNIDERVNLFKSTIAAAEYLSDLYNIFNDWALAVSAYNAGEYRVLNAISKGNTRDYRRLCEMNLLPKETQNYVAKIWVARELFERSEEFKFNFKPSVSTYQQFPFSFKIKRDMAPKELFKISSMSSKRFYRLNNDLVDLKNLKGVKVYLPEDKYKKISNHELSVSRVRNPKVLRKYGLNQLEIGDYVKIQRSSDKKIFITNLKTGKKIQLNRDILQRSL